TSGHQPGNGDPGRPEPERLDHRPAVKHRAVSRNPRGPGALPGCSPAGPQILALLHEGPPKLPGRPVGWPASIRRPGDGGTGPARFVSGRPNVLETFP